MFMITRACQHEDRETTHPIPKDKGLKLQFAPGFELLRIRDPFHEKDSHEKDSGENLRLALKLI